MFKNLYLKKQSLPFRLVSFLMSLLLFSNTSLLANSGRTQKNTHQIYDQNTLAPHTSLAVVPQPESDFLKNMPSWIKEVSPKYKSSQYIPLATFTVKALTVISVGLVYLLTAPHGLSVGGIIVGFVLTELLVISCIIALPLIGKIVKFLWEKPVLASIIFLLAITFSACSGKRNVRQAPYGVNNSKIEKEYDDSQNIEDIWKEWFAPYKYLFKDYYKTKILFIKIQDNIENIPLSSFSDDKLKLWIMKNPDQVEAINGEVHLVFTAKNKIDYLKDNLPEDIDGAVKKEIRQGREYTLVYNSISKEWEKPTHGKYKVVYNIFKEPVVFYWNEFHREDIGQDSLSGLEYSAQFERTNQDRYFLGEKEIYNKMLEVVEQNARNNKDITTSIIKNQKACQIKHYNKYTISFKAETRHLSMVKSSSKKRSRYLPSFEINIIDENRKEKRFSFINVLDFRVLQKIDGSIKKIIIMYVDQGRVKFCVINPVKGTHSFSEEDNMDMFETPLFHYNKQSRKKFVDQIERYKYLQAEEKFLDNKIAFVRIEKGPWAAPLSSYNDQFRKLIMINYNEKHVDQDSKQVTYVIHFTNKLGRKLKRQTYVVHGERDIHAYDINGKTVYQAVCYDAEKKKWIPTKKLPNGYKTVFKNRAGKYFIFSLQNDQFSRLIWNLTEQTQDEYQSLKEWQNQIQNLMIKDKDQVIKEYKLKGSTPKIKLTDNHGDSIILEGMMVDVGARKPDFRLIVKKETNKIIHESEDPYNDVKFCNVINVNYYKDKNNNIKVYIKFVKSGKVEIIELSSATYKIKWVEENNLPLEIKDAFNQGSITQEQYAKKILKRSSKTKKNKNKKFKRKRKNSNKKSKTYKTIPKDKGLNIDRDGKVGYPRSYAFLYDAFPNTWVLLPNGNYKHISAYKIDIKRKIVNNRDAFYYKDEKKLIYKFPVELLVQKVKTPMHGQLKKENGVKLYFHAQKKLNQWKPVDSLASGYSMVKIENGKFIRYIWDKKSFSWKKNIKQDQSLNQQLFYILNPEYKKHTDILPVLQEQASHKKTKRLWQPKDLTPDKLTQVAIQKIIPKATKSQKKKVNSLHYVPGVGAIHYGPGVGSIKVSSSSSIVFIEGNNKLYVIKGKKDNVYPQKSFPKDTSAIQIFLSVLINILFTIGLASQSLKTLYSSQNESNHDLDGDKNDLNLTQQAILVATLEGILGDMKKSNTKLERVKNSRYRKDEKIKYNQEFLNNKNNLEQWLKNNFELVDKYFLYFPQGNNTEEHNMKKRFILEALEEIIYEIKDTNKSMAMLEIIRKSDTDLYNKVSNKINSATEIDNSRRSSNPTKIKLMIDCLYTLKSNLRKSA